MTGRQRNIGSSVVVMLGLVLCTWATISPAKEQVFELAGYRLRAASNRAAGIAEGRAALDADVFKDDPVGERSLLWYMGGAALGIPDAVALDEVVLRLRSLHDQNGDVVAGAYAGFLRGSRMIELGQVGAGMAEVLRAANVLDVNADPAQRSIAASELCRSYLLAEWPGQAIDHCRRYTALAEELGDPVTLARARYLEASANSNAGELDRAVGLWRQSREGFLAAGLDTLAGRAAGSLAGDLVAMHRFEEALALAQEAIAAAEAAGNPISVGLVRGVRAEALAGLDRVQEALADIDAAIAIVEDLDAPSQLSTLLRTKKNILQGHYGGARTGAAAGADAGKPEVAALGDRIRALEAAIPDASESEEIVSLESRYMQREQTLRIRELEHENRLRQHELRVAELEATRQELLLREQRRFMLMATVVVVLLVITLVALALLLRTQRRLARSFRDQAYRDALTSLPNRRAIMERIGQLLREPHAAEQGHALLMIDLDHFKTINDVGGHPFGDAVLADLGRCLLQLVPEDGMIARLGGEEFLMLCPRLGREHALALADRIRFAVHGLSRHAGERFMPVTVSQGLAVFDGVDCHDQSSWMQRADHAVYRAKANGRDRVEVAVPTVRTAGDAVCT